MVSYFANKLTPIPKNISPGRAIAAGAGIGYALGKWREINTDKVYAYCAKMEKERKVSRTECLTAGRKAILAQVKQAKAEAQANAQDKIQHGYQYSKRK